MQLPKKTYRDKVKIRLQVAQELFADKEKFREMLLRMGFLFIFHLVITRLRQQA
jgi:hypothetical protein